MSFLAYLEWLFRKVAPYCKIAMGQLTLSLLFSEKLTLYSTNGIGMNAIEMKARVLLAHATPR
jgi:hypothetical protein